MKKAFLVLTILMAFATSIFMGCADESDSSGDSTTVLSGRTYLFNDGEGHTVSMSFAQTGNSVIVNSAYEGGVVITGTYSLSGSTLKISISTSTQIMTYDSIKDCIYFSGAIYERLL